MRRGKRRELFLKFTAVAVAGLILVSSSGAIFEVMTNVAPEYEADQSSVNQTFLSRPCEVRSVLAQAGLWVGFDSSTPGTPAETHVTISDTSGITIVADFYGFWNSSRTINATTYHELDMPGASSMREPGAPMLPTLFEYVEIPHNVDVTIQVLASSVGSKSGFNILPAPPPNIPVGSDMPHGNVTPVYTSLRSFLGPVYFNDTFFPGITTETEGELSTTSLIMRGHRLLGLSFYPVQFNPVTGVLLVYSQIVIKVKYSIPAQIQPIPKRIRSRVFENILMNTILNYNVSSTLHIPEFGFATISQFTPAEFQDGAEYLIITTQPFKAQADRLAEWKEKKGVPSKVVIAIPSSRQDVKGKIERAYNEWDPAPTYVLLLGDVESIPANYDADYEGMINSPDGKIRVFEKQEDNGIIASDLGYFTIDGNSYIPDMIYGRISVDTEEQARTIVDKILQYEQNPPSDELFYESIFSAGHFEDIDPLNAKEDEGYPSIYYLERIRHFLADNYGYSVHINYSCYWLHYEAAGIPIEDLQLRYPLDPAYPVASKLLRNTLPEGYEWLRGYTVEPYLTYSKRNITSNINEGRFFVLYYSHGGSKNMVHRFDAEYPPDGQLDNDDRDLIEGWHLPTFNTSYFSDLNNGNELPLIVNIACNTGWFDGETDQDFMTLTGMVGVDNPFEIVDNECFSEDIIRLETGGAIAAISSSRPSYAGIGGYLLSGLIQAFWPGYLDVENQPIYEMGAALLFGKLYAKSQWKRMRESDLFLGSIRFPMNEERTTFEEYHLFGDPETQLWTAAPSEFLVSHPISIGTSDPQQFVVTVRNKTDLEPVQFAKVCIQDPSIYQVGYTNTRGQIVFEVAPSDIPAYINVTVTKHNFRPNQSEILVKASTATVSVSPSSGLYQDPIAFTVSGFNTNNPVEIYMDDEPVATVEPGSQTAQGTVLPGSFGYVNIWAAQATGSTRDLWEPVAHTIFYRLSSALNPDPYIYSQDDSSTWYLADGQKVWDNPCIALYLGSNPISEVQQNVAYNVKVTVYNRGNVRADETDVSLSYAPLGGGVTWTSLPSVKVSIDPFGSAEATFTWIPLLSNTVSLRVVVDHENEKLSDKDDNIGYESVNVVPLCSPGNRTLHVGNPTNNTDYVFIDVRQQGYPDEIWNATILGYSSQAMTAG
ncbi:MAG: C25 family cysteine peptidase, partial [Candidatus Thorarchaeota archaeon]